MRRSLLILLPLCLAACDDPSAVNDTPTGAYVETKDISQTGDPNYLTKGCDAQGNPVIQIDSRLKKGMKIGVINKVQTEGTGVGELAFSTEVTNVTATALAQKFTVDKVTNFTGYTAGSAFNIACSLAGDTVNCTSADAPQNTGAEHAKYEDCQFTAQPSVTGKLTMGTYTFKAGQAVTAYKLALTGTGPVKCGTETFADAKLEYNLLTSNDLPSTDFNFCGGTMVSFYTKMTGGGKTLKATFSERADAATTAATFLAERSNSGPELPAFFFANQLDGKYLDLRPSLLRMFTNL
ncbi:MAG: hypothetical protein ABL958_05520 [Bdellovibrionia bacterium]